MHRREKRERQGSLIQDIAELPESGILFFLDG